jgi:hypothetical protein
MAQQAHANMSHNDEVYANGLIGVTHARARESNEMSRLDRRESPCRLLDRNRQVRIRHLGKSESGQVWTIRFCERQSLPP